MTRRLPHVAEARARTRATALALALLALLVFAATGGGRVVGSDEVTMLELSRALLRGGVAVPEGATLAGPDGRHYTKNAAGQAIVALPLVAAAEGAARVAVADPARRVLAVRFAASFFNALVTALLLAVFYAGARSLGARARPALAAAMLLGFTTPVWPYAKSFMAEPLQSLGLLFALLGAAHAAGGQPRGAGLAAVGAFVAISAKLSMLPLALACVAVAVWRARGAARALPLAGIALALLGHALYNVARFGTPFETGYGSQATGAAYSTPLHVGLYGLLLSSGKGVLWFAPVLWFAGRGWQRLRHARNPAAPAAAIGVALAWAVALLLYGTFEHWAGDGSFGPRYLVPLLPLAFLGPAFALEGLSRGRRRLVRALALAGLLVQVGGVAIYFGAQMREAGDYPYTLPLDHPRFMSDSHFNPRFTPITAHWRMLARNLGLHLRGERPKLAGGTPEARVGVSAADQRELLKALDFWWLYAGYAGVPTGPLGVALAALVALAGWAAMRLAAALDVEERGP